MPFALQGFSTCVFLQAPSNPALYLLLCTPLGQVEFQGVAGPIWMFGQPGASTPGGLSTLPKGLGTRPRLPFPRNCSNSACPRRRSPRTPLVPAAVLPRELLPPHPAGLPAGGGGAAGVVLHGQHGGRADHRDVWQRPRAITVLGFGCQGVRTGVQVLLPGEASPNLPRQQTLPGNHWRIPAEALRESGWVARPPRGGVSFAQAEGRAGKVLRGFADFGWVFWVGGSTLEAWRGHV